MMQQTTFKKIDTLVAWLIFAIAAIVYGLTVEPTASLWDCPEFIVCGYKLEIGHPPGAPFFMLVANLFSQFASEPSQVALMVNLLSALLSAGCIFFLYLTITHLARRIILNKVERVSERDVVPLSKVITIEACGVVGALAYAFSDTFWYSAVEAEVYAFSSFLTALMFWIILKWEDESDSPQSDRWIVLIAYITGLSVGVHLLCLLCLPAMAFVVYFRKSEQGRFHMDKRRLLRLSATCLFMMLVGFSSYGVIYIRAHANPPMCENAPDNISSLRSYLNREQYGKTPLLYGPAYSSELDYEATRRENRYVYKEKMFFPRMHSLQHAKAYEEWMGDIGMKDNLPTAAENLRFFITYQLNFMYWRYFLWNFVGRQNNIQGHGEVEHGNWITGFRWIDDWLLGCDTSKLPSDLAQNKGRNVFYALPLLLGLAGLLWQWRKGREGRRQLLIVMLLFVMTGVAIVVYLNQTPLQPRERDYAYVGSFYAFAIWIGMGVGYLSEKVKVICGKLFSDERVESHAALVSILVGIGCLLVPLQMVSQTWDDHDRSGRYTCRDFGANYLESMQTDGHPIILTDGDNDTFPLWYNHEVEGVRTDTRDCNMEYMQTDWYIDQMKRPAYDSPSLPISWHHEDYQAGQREYIPIRPELKEDVEEYMRQQPEAAKELLGEEPFELKNIINRWVLNEREEMQCIPTDSVTITSDEGTMRISLKGKHGLYKNELMVLEMLSTANWARPIYLSINMGPGMLSFLRDHLVLEGLAYRISPTAEGQQVDVERLYDNVMHRFRYGGLSKKGIYVDEDVKHMANTHQLVMSVLIDSLLQQGDKERALSVCQKWQQEMPSENIPYTEAALSMARCFYLNGQLRQGDDIITDLLRRSVEWRSWIDTISPSRRAGSLYTWHSWQRIMQQALAVAAQYEREKVYYQYSKQYENYIKDNQKD